jgi:hypothetical protein
MRIDQSPQYLLEQGPDSWVVKVKNLAIRQVGFDQVLNPILDSCLDVEGNVLVYESPECAYAVIDG